jgi:type I restriction enzyme, S subunit
MRNSMDDWQEVTIEDIKAKSKYALSTGPFGSSIGAQYFVSSGVPVIRGSNLSTDISTRLVDDSYVYISAEKANEFKRSIVQEGDIIFTSWGTINQIGLIEKGCKYKEYVISNKQMKLTPNLEIVSARFLYYWFSSPQTQGEILNSNIGSSVPGINLTMLRGMKILLPSLPEQRAIAEVLSSLDDKIDLLHRQNKTLEGLAETLFRQWFVEEAEEGWEVGTLGDFAQNIRSNVTLSNMVAEDKYVALEHIDRKNIALARFGSSETVASNKSAFMYGDILFGKLRSYFHKVCLAPFDGICSTDILVIRPFNSMHRCFCLFAFFQEEVVNFSDATSGGTRMPRTSWEVLSGFPFNIPSEPRIMEFENAAGPMVDKVLKNIEVIRTIAQLRDTLLPKLMSGEVRVRI